MFWSTANHLTHEELAKMPYVAYGSNMSLEGMAQRCPGSQPLRLAHIEATLVFRNVADVIPTKGARLPVALWWINPEHVADLDSYEAWPRLYSRVIVDVRAGKKRFPGFMYVMNTKRISPPSPSYYHIIRQGYRDFNAAPGPLHSALEHSFGDLSNKDKFRNLMRFHSAVAKVPRKIQRPVRRRGQALFSL